MSDLRVYFTVGNGWWIGPLWSYKVGDVVDVPDREPHFGDERPGGKGEVQRIDSGDGMAFAARIPENPEEVPFPC